MASRYRPEFRVEAVHLGIEAGLVRGQISADLGVGCSSQNNWVGKDRSDTAKSTAQSDLARELAELRSEPVSAIGLIEPTNRRMLRENREMLEPDPK